LSSHSYAHASAAAAGGPRRNAQGEVTTRSSLLPWSESIFGAISRPHATSHAPGPAACWCGFAISIYRSLLFTAAAATQQNNTASTVAVHCTLLYTTTATKDNTHTTNEPPHAHDIHTQHTVCIQ